MPASHTYMGNKRTLGVALQDIMLLWGMSVPPPEPRTIDQLIEELDPDRSYGYSDYEDVVENVRLGVITIRPGVDRPVLRDSSTGRAIAGTGTPHGKKTRRRGWAKQFDDRAGADFDSVYEALVKSATYGDVRAQIYFLDRCLGTPKEQPVEGYHSDQLLELLSLTYESTTTHNPVARDAIMVAETLGYD